MLFFFQPANNPDHGSLSQLSLNQVSHAVGGIITERPASLSLPVVSVLVASWLHLHHAHALRALSSLVQVLLVVYLQSPAPENEITHHTMPMHATGKHTEACWQPPLPELGIARS
jgi:hypothetical protein